MCHVCTLTVQDLFQRKVRESTFEIQNLFGSHKPFSCDIVIRHADEMIVMPIEIEVRGQRSCAQEVWLGVFRI